MSALAGTGQLLRLNLRRDRIMLPAWLVAIVATLYSSVASTAALYPTPESREQTVSVINTNPAVIALYGPATDLGTLGGLATWKPNTILAVLIAVLSMLIVVRHTRADEEAGRLELVGSGVVGRHAALTAALIVAFGTNIVLVVLLAASLAGQDLPADGVVAMALGFGAIGCVFAAIAAVAAQLVESSRTANGITTSALGLAFLLRAAGDTAGDLGPGWLTWLSPIGWVQRVRPYGDLRWWPLLLPLGLAVLAAAAAYLLAARRDLAAGLLAARRGPAHAAPALASPFALAWRLHRWSLLAWAVGFVVLSGVLGAVASSIGEVAGNSELRDFLQRLGGNENLTDGYLAFSMSVAAMVATAFAVQAALRLRAEENAQRVEPLLATRVDRIRWAMSHFVIAVLGPAVLLGVAGLVAGLTHGARTGSVGEQLPRVLGSALVQLPAVWVVAGITLAAFGLAPRFAAVGWAALVLFLLITELGPMLQLDQWLLDVSPFSHVPRLPLDDLTLAPLVALVAIAVAFSAAGLVGLRRRDIG